EQLPNLTAVVWLYRGESHRFLALVQRYLDRTIREAAAIANSADAFRVAYVGLENAAAPFIETQPTDSPLHALVKERDHAAKACTQTLDRWTGRIAKEWKTLSEPTLAAQKT